MLQAAHFGHSEAVKLLLRHNAASDFANVKGTTALMRASQEGHVEIAQLLINSDVDVNRKNHEGMNALMLASQRGHASIVEVLVKAGAAMDEQTSQGSTALMLACKRGHEKCAEVLVSMGAEIFMRDRRFRTARDTATRRNHHGLLCWLDTQVQVRRIQEGRHAERHMLLHEMREARMQGRLQLQPTVACAVQLFRAACRYRDVLRAGDTNYLEHLTIQLQQQQQQQQQGWTANSVVVNSFDKYPNYDGCSSAAADAALLAQFCAATEDGCDSGARPLPVISTHPKAALQAMVGVAEIYERRNSVADAVPVFEHSAKLSRRVQGYVDFEWPMLLLRYAPTRPKTMAPLCSL